MELRELTYFVAVAEELHFGRAAERLQIAQPAVSQQIARLERELGVRLFDRSSRRVRLSSAGHALLPQVRRALDNVTQVQTLAAELVRGDRGILRVGTTEGMGWRLQRILLAFRQEKPGVTVSVTAGHTPAKLADLRQGHLDCAFVRSAPPAEDLVSLALWDEPLLAVLPAHHPLARLDAVPLAALADMPVIVIPRSDNPGAFDSFAALCRSAGFEPVLGPTYRTAEDALANIAASAATWTAFHASHHALLDGGQAPGVAIRPFAGLEVSAPCTLTWPSNPAAAVRSFVDTICRLRDSDAFTAQH